MAETMYAAPGRRPRRDPGRRAQARHRHRHLRGPRRPRACSSIPRSCRAEGEAECEEGCLSVPGYYDKVTRAATDHASARRTSAASRSSSTADGLLAVCIQHEMDHLRRQGLRRLPVAAEARAARRQAAQEAAARGLSRRAQRLRGRALRVGFAGTPPFAARGAGGASLDAGFDDTAGPDAARSAAGPRPASSAPSPVKALAQRRAASRCCSRATLQDRRRARAAARGRRSTCWSSPPTG